MKLIATLSIGMLLCVAVVGCRNGSSSGANGGGTLTSDQSRAKAQLEEQMRDAAQTAQTYRAMDTIALLTKLVEQSKAQIEPFNSPAYRELETRKDVNAGSLVALVKENPTMSGLLPLLLLQKVGRQSYVQVPVELRASILTDALQHWKYFNVWGIPNYYLEPASLALIGTGRAATPALKKMLSSTRAAPVWGSKEYMIYETLKYRLGDYALFFLEQIAGNTSFRLPDSITDRDALIKRMETI
jgi:hypothetical protein